MTRRFLLPVVGLLLLGCGNPPASSAAARCGDGAIAAGEDCDDGEANSDTTPDACRTDCRAPRCGDGVVDSGEACDDGEANDDTAPDACRTDCRAPRCGDGVIDSGEACDDGEANDDREPDRCRTDCHPARCGDGVRDTGEGCDAGAGNSDTVPGACRTRCVVPVCGDGVTDPGEECDEGEANSDTTADACRTDCLLPVCGDGVVDRGRGEECDDSNHYPTDGCDDCVYRPVCDPSDPEPHPLDATEGRVWDGAELVVAGTVAGLPGPFRSCDEYRRTGGPVYALPVPRAGDLEARVAVPAGGFRPLVEIYGGCGGQPVIACEEGSEAGETTVAWARGVRPEDNILFVRIQPMEGEPGPFELRLRIWEPLPEADACRADGSTGSCAEGLACLDPDGDGRGRCGRLVPRGGACDPSGAENACLEGTCTCVDEDCTAATCEGTCGDGVVQPWEECDEGEANGVGNCTAACRHAGRSCETPFRLHLAPRPDGLFEWQGTIDAETSRFTSSCGRETAAHSEAYAAFTAPSSGTWVFRLVRERSSVRLVLSLLGSACTSGAELACEEVNAVSWPWPTIVVDLAAGETVHAVVDGDGPFAPDAPPTFVLRAERIACGDGVVGMTEECDDGNDSDLDNCLSDCTAAGGDCATPWSLEWDEEEGRARWTGFLSRGGRSFHPGCSEESHQDVVGRFVAPFAGEFAFEARGGALSLRAGACETSTEVGCANRGMKRTVLAHGLAAGEGLWVVLDSGANRLAPDTGEFSVEVQPLLCGDGRHVLPEECDDGNLVGGDGCDEECRIDLREVEPNGTTSLATALSPGSTLAASLPAGDQDWFRIDAREGFTYGIAISTGMVGECLHPWLSPVVFDDSGAIVRTGPFDGSPGDSPCDASSFQPQASGPYYVWVQGGWEDVHRYFVAVAEQPVP